MRGHQPLVVAPALARGTPGGAGPFPCPVVRLPSAPVPGYRSFRVGLPGRRLDATLTGHGTDVVHLASPFVLGSSGAAAAVRAHLPMVAVYQTDMPAYARVYGAGKLGEAAAWRWLRRIHNAADRTLAPSAASAASLREHGVQRVWLWGRGVDTERFDPARRSSPLRQQLAPGGEVLVGYVGRLAPEKRVELLWQVAEMPGVRLVIVGGGPAGPALRRALPRAVFLGPRHGAELAAIYASLDVFVHGGACETFGQTLQEAGASGLPVVAPAVGGPLDIVDQGRTGYLVAPGDAGAIACATARLVGDPRLRLAMGRAGGRRRSGAAGPRWVTNCSPITPRCWPPPASGAGRTGLADPAAERLPGLTARPGPGARQVAHQGWAPAMRIVRLANFITPHSGGLRTALRELGAGYAAAGHEPVLVMPGAADGDEQTPQGRVITLRGPVLPLSGGYRLLLSKRRVRDILESLRPDRLEVSDRTTLRWTGPWARRHDVPAVMVSHESVAGLLSLPLRASRQAPSGEPLAGPAGRMIHSVARVLADTLNARTAQAYAQVVCTTRWAAAEFERLGVPNLRHVPLGVDLELFSPRRHCPPLRQRYAAADEVLLVHCGRLSVEKSRTGPSTRWPGCAPRACRRCWWWPVTGRCARGWSGRRRAPRCRCISPASSRAGWRLPPCWPRRTWCSRPGRWRPSAWPRWRRWRLARRWW